MEKWMYVLPNKICGLEENNNQIKITTQKESIVLNVSYATELMSEILSVANGRTISELYPIFENKVNENGLVKIINFLSENNVIYVSDRKLKEGEEKFIKYLSQYTISLNKYLERMNKIKFGIIGQEETTNLIIELLEGFALNYELITILDKADLKEVDIVLSAYDSTEIKKLFHDAEIIEENEGLLWMFVLFYEDSFLLSPLLNKENYTDFNSFKEQINIENITDFGISRNELVQRMGVSEMLMDVLNSIMKLNIQTSYNKTIIYDSIEKTLMLERIYYFPKNYSDERLKVQRWDGEV